MGTQSRTATRRRAKAGPAALERARSEIGMTLIELIVAITLLAIVMTALGAFIGISLKSVQLARARQVAESAANKRIEELRDVDYPQLALASVPVYNSDPENPDHFVSGAEYDYTGNGTLEPMIVETSPPGPVSHIESPVTVGGTVVDVYEYVTWVDDPGISGTQNLKRVTVVVRYHNVAVKGTDHILRESILFTPGTVTLPSAASTTTTTIPEGPTTTTTVPAGGCGSFSVSGGSGNQVGFTATTTVTVSMSLANCGSDVRVSFSNDGTTWEPDPELLYDSTNPSTAWTISGGDGTHVISGRARDGAAGDAVILPEQSIILDTTLPTAPTAFSRTVTCSGSNRTVHLSWGAASDTYLVGYRIYRSTGVSWQIISSTAGTTASDTQSKTLTSVRYYVRAYDKAGNESNATNTITLSKNQCS